MATVHWKRAVLRKSGLRRACRQCGGLQLSRCSCDAWATDVLARAEGSPVPAIMQHMTLRLAVSAMACMAVVFWGASPAFATDGVTVAKSKVTAVRQDDGTIKATVDLVNNQKDQQLTVPREVKNRPGCTLDVPKPELPGYQGTSVDVILSSQCFADKGASNVRIDLDGEGDTLPMPPITVLSPVQVVSPWAALWVGAALWVLSFFAFWANAMRIHRRVKNAKVPDPSASDTAADQTKHDQVRAASYLEVQRLVDARWETVKPPNSGLLMWRKLERRAYDATDIVQALAPSWSLKDSWMASVTALISAVVAVGSSSQLFTALNEDQPKGPLAVMALAGLIGVGLVAVANTVVKLIGKPVNEVTVRGLAVAGSALFAAAVFEIVAVTIAAGQAFNAWAGVPKPRVQNLLSAGLVKPVVMIAIAVLLGALSWWYLTEKLEQQLNDGVPLSGVPAIDMAEFATWTVPEPKPNDVAADVARTQAQRLLAERIKTALGPWLNEDGQARTRIGEPWTGNGASIGEDKWGPGGAIPEPDEGAGPKAPAETPEGVVVRKRQQQPLPGRKVAALG